MSDAGRAALATLGDADLSAGNTLSLLTRLRQRLPPALAGAVLTQARLRRKAAAKFPAAEHLFFTPEALEQATAAEVAAVHAEWLDRHAPPGAVLDLGCGIGGDLLALAQRRQVIAYETDPVRALFARVNAATAGVGAQTEVVTADWTTALARGELPAASAAYADPARRVNERRVFHLHQLQPPLAALLELRDHVAVLGVKVMAGVQDEELPPNCGVEFISHAGVCKEAVLWFGAAAWQARWATVLHAGGCERLPTDLEPPPQGELAAGQVLYEPDPAVIRAHSLGRLCARLGAQLFDPQIAYLVAPRWQPEPLAQAFAIDEVHSFSLELLNRRLQALGIGQVELKKRGFPVEPETLRGRLRLVRGGRAGVVIFTRRGEERLMVLGRRLTDRTTVGGTEDE